MKLCRVHPGVLFIAGILVLAGILLVTGLATWSLETPAGPLSR